jgi:hypothetical protein
MQKSGLGSDGWLGVLVWVVWGRFFLDPLRQWWTALTRVMAIRSLRWLTNAEYGFCCLCAVMWARCCRILVASGATLFDGKRIVLLTLQTEN